MSNLSRFESQGLEFYINTSTGAAYATQSGYVRMMQMHGGGVSQPAISKRISSYNLDSKNEAESLSGYGLDSYNQVFSATVETSAGVRETVLIPAEPNETPETIEATEDCLDSLWDTTDYGEPEPEYLSWLDELLEPVEETEE